jgi:ArsR family transcriptional regulator
MLPSEIGERAEAAVLAALVGAGKHVLRPFGEQRRYDLAYEENGRLIKVQCKSGSVQKGAIRFPTRSVGRRSVRDYRGDVDFFGVYCHDRREVYLVPVADVPSRLASLRFTPARNGQKVGVRVAAPYLLSAQQLTLIELTDIDIVGHNESMIVDEGLSLDLLAGCCGVLTPVTLEPGQAEATAQIFKALSDPHRVRILNLLANATQPVCVCEFTEQLDLSQGTTSFHLKKLTAAGLIEREQRGTWAYYSLNRDAARALSEVLEFKETT